MQLLTALIDDNVRLLRQGALVVGALDDETFARVPVGVAQGSIGAHVRHCLDHYACLLDGLAAGQIDYDRRERDARLETDRALALERLSALADGLAAGRATLRPKPLHVRAERGPGRDDEALWSDSSLSRELSSAASHTVHHFALIAVFLRVFGLTPPEGFGVAPSTLRFWEESRACAR